jgi:hypothetical protein
VNDAGTQLTVTTPARAAGLVNITVTTDAGPSAAGLQAQYRYENSPTISAVSVRAGSIKGGTQVNFTGTNLYGAAVKFGGVAQTISVNSAGTVATIATHARAAGAYAISIVTPVGTIAAGTFTYVAPPTVSSLSVRTGTYTGGTGVWVSGARLDGARITIGGKVAKVLATGTTRVLIATPAGTVGVHGIVVVQTVGGSVNSGLFTWVR